MHQEEQMLDRNKLITAIVDSSKETDPTKFSDLRRSLYAMSLTALAKHFEVVAKTDPYDFCQPSKARQGVLTPELVGAALDLEQGVGEPLDFPNR